MTNGNGNGDEPPSKKPNPSKLAYGIVALFIVILFLLAVLSFSASNKRAKEKAEAEAKEKAAAIQMQQYRAPTPPGPCEGPWSSKTFDVPDDGLRLLLCQGSRRYPKFGGVKTLTSSGQTYTDLPGVDHDGMFNPTGWFTFHPDPPGSKRRIEIYNRW